MATTESSQLAGRDPKLVEAEAENIRRIKGIKSNNAPQPSNGGKSYQDAPGATQAKLPQFS